MNEVQEFLKDCGVYYLATLDGDQPRVRPFGTAEIINDKLYIQTGKSKNVYKQIEANNNVELCAFKDGRWIRISGKLIPDDTVESKKEMLDKNPNLRSMYDENDDNCIVLYFESGVATINSFTEAPKVIEF
jgi:uncharacterized pyridoxamine 5'-phosphate oxidase family protein